MTVRRLDSFSTAVIVGAAEHFAPDTKPQLAFFGIDETTAGRVAVLDGQLVERERCASAAGLVVARESFDGRTYFDRVPLDCTLRTENGGRAMWLSHHRGEMPEGILRVSAGHAALNGIGIEAVDPTTTLTAFGMGEAYANAASAAEVQAAAARTETAAGEGPLATVHQLHPTAA
jgi:hypothetical protein